MATLTYVLDKRGGGDEFPIKLRITHGRGKTAYIGTGIKIKEDQWDGKKIINHKKQDTLNAFLDAKLNNAESIHTKLFVAGLLDNYSVSELKKIIENNGEAPAEKKSQGNFIVTFL